MWVSLAAASVRSSQMFKSLLREPGSGSACPLCARGAKASTHPGIYVEVGTTTRSPFPVTTSLAGWRPGALRRAGADVQIPRQRVYSGKRGSPERGAATQPGSPNHFIYSPALNEQSLQGFRSSVCKVSVG